MKQMKKSVLACAACLVLIAVACIGWKSHVRATGELLTVTEINYQNSTITLTGNGDSVVYFSNSSAKKWEEAGTFENGKCVFDISWVSLSSNYVISFKGDKSDGILKVTIPKQVTNFKVKYVPDNNEQPFTFTGVTTGRTIQWRKNGVGEWSFWNNTTTNDSLSYLKENGATLYFRLAPENGNSVSNTGKRASKEVSVKVSAKKAAPTVKVDASKFTVPLTAKMSYRVLELDADGNLQGETSTNWVTVGGTKSYSLSEIAPSAMYTDVNKAANSTKPVAIQFKNSATKSAQESRIATVIIPAQDIVTEEKDGIGSIVYTSSKTLEVEVKAASNKEVAYEYCIVDKDNYIAGDLDYNRVSWTTLSGTKITLNSTAAKEGSHIYVRRKAKGNQGDENFALASKELELTGANGVVYPAAVTMDKLIQLTAVAGQINGSTADRKLVFTANSAYANTTVKSIEFKDEYGGDSIGNGTVTCESESVKNADGEGYIITTYITSTAALDNNEKAWNTPLKAYITLSNGEVIKTTDSNGVILTLYPPTKVANPTEAEKVSYGDYYKQYKTDFDRIYMSNYQNHDKTFKFILEFGDATKDTQIQTMKYGSTTINAVPFTTESGKSIDDSEKDSYVPGTGAMVCYDTIVKNGKTVRRAHVTIHADVFEASVKEEEIGKKLPIVITLTNKEVLDDDIYMTLVKTAAFVDENTISWTFQQGGLDVVGKETTDSNGNKVPGETLKDHIIELNFSDKLGGYIPNVTSVKWEADNNKEHSLILEGKGTKIILSNAELNKLPLGSGKLIITFNNGFVLEGGWITVQ